MDLPDVQATLSDPQTGVTYEVCAYRPITRAEALMAIRTYTSGRKRKPKRGSVVRIITIIGAND